MADDSQAVNHEASLPMKICAHFPMTTLRSSLLSRDFFSLYGIISPKNEHDVMTRGDSKDASGPNPAGAKRVILIFNC